MPRRATEFNKTEDALVLSFMQYLQTEAGASVYTQRNYRQALHEFTDWYTTERKQPRLFAFGRVPVGEFVKGLTVIALGIHRCARLSLQVLHE